MVFYAFSCLWVFISHSELGDSLFVGLPRLCTGTGVRETIMCPCVFTRVHVCVCVYRANFGNTLPWPTCLRESH